MQSNQQILFENDAIPQKMLNQPSIQAANIEKERKNELNPLNYDEYTNWKTNMPKNYGNFMQMTTSPQRSPFGVAGYPPAMKKLEQQLPERPTTLNNPFMNVPIHDYGIPQKYSKADLKDDPNPNFYEKLFMTPDNALWRRQASERSFTTMPNSSNPNEQTKFAEWLYGKNFVCKSGSIYDRFGYPYTPDSLVCNGFNAASPENGGQVDNNYGVPNTQPNASPWVNNPNYGWGFGGIQGGIPMTNLTPGSPTLYPYPLVPHFGSNTNVK